MRRQRMPQHATYDLALTGLIGLPDPLHLLQQPRVYVQINALLAVAVSPQASVSGALCALWVS
ncbi:hypothetical protein [Delftia acidovorans]|uniref:hypothetical protein n=1 Tax=Delftia acidovorans TaxID=80866 RepID=UPI0030198FB0